MNPIAALTTEPALYDMPRTVIGANTILGMFFVLGLSLFFWYRYLTRGVPPFKTECTPQPQARAPNAADVFLDFAGLCRGLQDHPNPRLRAFALSAEPPLDALAVLAAQAPAQAMLFDGLTQSLLPRARACIGLIQRLEKGLYISSDERAAVAKALDALDTVPGKLVLYLQHARADDMRALDIAARQLESHPIHLDLPLALLDAAAPQKAH